MKYSQVYGKTMKTDAGGSQFVSHQLLTRGGFVQESTAGRYYFLPLGWRVHDKIKKIIKEEMDAVGGQEMITPVLHPIELWEETNRTSSVGFELMSIKDARGAGFALGGTAEEMFVDSIRRLHLSYKDLPLNLYQFSTKFRDEKRARGGLLRVREFVMKDAYSFDLSEAEFKKVYEQMAEVYTRIFSRLGLETVKVEADNGYIGGEYCHEYQVISDIGEGRFFMSEDGTYVAHEDVAKFIIEPVNPDEEMNAFEIIDQPEHVQTMKEMQEHYKRDHRFFLKNVVYKTTQGDIVIATIRGDLKVNKTKLEHVLDMVGQLEDATAEDLHAIGSKTGYVHSWGHTFVHPRKAKTEDRDCRVIYVADHSLRSVRNFIGGQKEEKTDSFNVNYGRDFTHEIESDIAMCQEGFLSENGSILHEKRGIEVGNIFQLGYHYSTRMKGANYIDRDGAEKPYYMGCYGIGLGRTLATIVETHHDDRGIIWPESVAPYHVHLIDLNSSERGQEVYDALTKAGIEVLWDDRDERAGVKFADSDLIGIPVRLVVSAKTGERVEFKLRSADESELLSLDEIISRFVTTNIQ